MSRSAIGSAAPAMFDVIRMAATEMMAKRDMTPSLNVGR